jgi:hypothetical protein
MITKRKNYKIVEELKTVKTCKNGKLKAGLICKCRILGGLVCSWMIEDKLHLFVDLGKMT